MRLGLKLLIIALAIALYVAVYAFSGGRLVFLFLPLLFGLPFVFRRNR